MTNHPPSSQQVLAIIPAHNEAKHIARVVQQVIKYLPVLVVDDGSGDDTPSIAAAAGAHVLRQQPNQGKGSALRTGFRQALTDGYQAAITLDGDGQHDPQDIPAFLHAYSKRKADLTTGQRDFRKMPTVRRTSNSLGTLIFSWAVGRHIPDNQSGYRLLSRRLMEALLDSKEAGFEFEVEMFTISILRGFALDWVDIRTIYADESSHIQPLHHVSEFFRISLKARRQIQAARRSGTLDTRTRK